MRISLHTAHIVRADIDTNGKRLMQAHARWFLRHRKKAVQASLPQLAQQVARDDIPQQANKPYPNRQTSSSEKAMHPQPERRQRLCAIQPHRTLLAWQCMQGVACGLQASGCWLTQRFNSMPRRVSTCGQLTTVFFFTALTRVFAAARAKTVAGRPLPVHARFCPAES